MARCSETIDSSNLTYLRNKLPDASEFAASSVKNSSRELQLETYSACHFKLKKIKRSKDSLYEGLFQLASLCSVQACVNTRS